MKVWPEPQVPPTRFHDPGHITANAPVRRTVTVKNGTHFMLFEKSRFQLFDAVGAFLKE